MLRAVRSPAVLAEPFEASDDRVRALLRAHYREVWRVLRHLGVSPAHAEDGAQLVFMAAASKLSRIEPGKERAFLVATAVRVAANQRRSAAARYERSDENLDEVVDDAPSAEDLLHSKRRRHLLDHVLDRMSDELRTAFVLFELEGLEMAQIAEIVGVPRGTIASRLRRAREAFTREANRLRARLATPEGR